MKKSTKTKSNWIETTIGNFCPFNYGKGLPKRERVDGPFAVYGSNGPVGYHNKFLIDEEGIVIGRKGTVGEVHFSARPFWPIDTTFYVKSVLYRNTRFTYYLLKAAGLHEMNTDSAVPGLNRAAAHARLIRVPSLPEQNAIAHILGTLDDKIELNRRMNKTLEEMSRALFKSWFIDFEPVRAKMEGKDTGLPEHIEDLFPDRLVESEFGEIPEGWKVKPLDTIARFQNGLALQKYRPKKGQARLPVVKIAQLRTGRADSKEWASATIKPECILSNGDIVFSWSGSLLVRVWCGGPAALNQHLFKVTSNKFPKWFYWHCVLIHLENFQHIARGKATTMGHIKRHHLSEALCVVPPDSAINSMTHIFGTPLKGQIANEIESRTLIALRDTLLPKLISGKIRFPEAGTAMEAQA